MNLNPFSFKPKYVKELEKELKNLKVSIDEKEIEEELALIEKSIDMDGSGPMAGSFSLVNEMFNRSQLQKLYCTETWFNICVRQIALSIASLPIKLEKRILVKDEVIHPNGKKETVTREMWVEATGEPEQQLFRFPNEMTTAIEFWMLVVIDLLATGDAFIFVQKDPTKLDEETSTTSEDRLREAMNRSRKTDVEALWRLNSAMVEPVRSNDKDRILDGYRMQTPQGQLDFTLDEIIHLKLPNPCDPILGASPIIAVLKEVLLDRYSKEHMIRFYKQGARLGGVVQTKKKLTKEQIVRLEKTFTATMTGKKNHHKTLILPEGMEYKSIEQNPGETSLIEFLRANKEPILSAFNVPPVKIGLLDGATFANAMIQNKTFYTDTVKPNTEFITQGINKSEVILRTERGIRMVFDFSEVEVLKEDLKAKAETASAMANSGLSVNEIRELVWKKESVEGGEVIPLIKRNQATPFSLLSAPKKNDTKVDVTNTQNDTETLIDTHDTNMTFEERVSELVSIAVANGVDISLAIPKAIEQAILEGFVPLVEPAEEEGEDKMLACGMTNKQAAEHLKVLTGEGIVSMIEKKREATIKMYERFEKFLIENIESKKAKSLKTKDVLPDLDEVEAFVQSELEFQISALEEAVKHGFVNSTLGADIPFAETAANQLLKQVVGRNIKSVTGTSLERLKRLIADAFEDEVSVSEISTRLRELIPDMAKARADMIARTETLSAVSLGQEVKRREFKRRYPKEGKRLKKMWLSAQDDRVRDSHEKVNEEVRGVDEKFSNGLLYPRDPAGPAEEVIQCRCSIIDYLPEDEEETINIVGNDSPLAGSVDQAEKRLRLALTKARLRKSKRSKSK